MTLMFYYFGLDLRNTQLVAQPTQYTVKVNNNKSTPYKNEYFLCTWAYFRRFKKQQA